jgi:hypothetical protein
MATVWRLRNNRAPPAYIDDADLTGADRGDASRIAAGLDQPASHDATRVFEDLGRARRRGAAACRGCVYARRQGTVLLIG